jgi:hypothetical protein
VNDRTEPLVERLTRWMEARVADTVPPSRPVVQLYGLEVIDRDGIDTLDPTAVRTVFITDGPDELTVLTRAESVPAFDFDAAATVEHAWVPCSGPAARPGSFVGRQRVTAVRVVGVRQ